MTRIEPAFLSHAGASPGVEPITAYPPPWKFGSVNTWTRQPGPPTGGGGVQDASARNAAIPVIAAAPDSTRITLAPKSKFCRRLSHREVDCYARPLAISLSPPPSPAHRTPSTEVRCNTPRLLSHAATTG